MLTGNSHASTATTTQVVVSANAATPAESQEKTANEIRIQPPTELQLSTDEVYALQKLKIQKELEDAVVSSMQTKFWIFVLVSAVLGFFGIRAFAREFVNEEIKTAIQASAGAKSATEDARQAIKIVQAQAVDYKGVVESASTAASKVAQRLDELKSRIDAEGARSIAASDLKISALTAQVEELGRTVAQLAPETDRNKEIINNALRRLEDSKADAKTAEAEFASNAKVEVTIVHFPEDEDEAIANFLSDEISSKGYRVSRSTWAQAKLRKVSEAKIQYIPSVKNHALDVLSVIKPLSASLGLGEVVLKMSRTLVPGSDSEIFLFLE